MAAYVTITNYGAETLVVCEQCGEQVSHGSDDAAAVQAAQRHNEQRHSGRRRDEEQRAAV
jgi:hypothetical protein